MFVVEAFLDTNILAYLYSKAPAEAEKRKRAEALVESVNFGISAQVLQELFVTLTRKGYIELSAAEAQLVIEGFDGTPCIPTDAALVRAAIETSIRFQISYWDSAIIAAAARLGVTTVFSEDLNHGQHYGSVTVINPFRG